MRRKRKGKKRAQDFFLNLWRSEIELRKGNVTRHVKIILSSVREIDRVNKTTYACEPV